MSDIAANPLSDLTPDMRASFQNHLSEVADALTLNSAQRHKLFRRMFDDGRSTIDEDCGYLRTDQVSLQSLYESYRRDPISQRVVTLWPEESWRKFPTVYDDESEASVSEFEAALEEIYRGAFTRSGTPSWAGVIPASTAFWSTLTNLDMLSRVGGYGVLVVGLNDGRKLSEPVEGFEDVELDLAEGAVKPLPFNKDLKVTYLEPLPEYFCSVGAIDTNSASPRFGLPLYYTVNRHLGGSVSPGPTGLQTELAESETIHWSRAVHVTTGSTSDGSGGRLRTDPALLVTLNRLWDLQKVYGGAGEGFWQGALPSIKMEPANPDVRMTPESTAQMNDAIDDYFTRMKRVLASDSMRIGTISPTVVNPQAHVDVLIEAICICEKVPVRIFKGSERGELSSAQDQTAHDERSDFRRQTVNTPRVIAPVIDRFILLGLTPPPREKGWGCKWPSLTEKSEDRMLDNMGKLVKALSDYIKGGVSELIDPLSLLVKYGGIPNAEAKQIIEKAARLAAEEAEENPPPPEGGAAPPVKVPPKPGDSGGKEEETARTPPLGQKTPAGEGTKPTKTAQPPTGNRSLVANEASRLADVQRGLGYSVVLTANEAQVAKQGGHKLNKPFRTSDGNSKFAVYTKNEKGAVVLVRFGDPNMETKRDSDERRKSFRARHGCDTDPGPRWKAKYWSCRMWEEGTTVGEVTGNASKSGSSKKKSTSGGIWRTTDEGGKVFIDGSGSVRAGGPKGKVVGGKTPVSKGAKSKPKSPVALTAKAPVKVTKNPSKKTPKTAGPSKEEPPRKTGGKSEPLSSAEKDAVTTYTTRAYEKINPALRSGKGASDPTVKKLDAAIAKSRLSAPETVYRAASIPQVNAALKSGEVEGLEFEDKAYTSTSKNASTADNFRRSDDSRMYKINVPKGANAIDAAKHAGGLAGEAEVLLPRGSKFKVKGVEKRKEKYKTREFGKVKTRTRTVEYIELDLVGDGVTGNSLLWGFQTNKTKKSKGSKTAGMWRTTSDGSKVYFGPDGKVRGGGPKGPVLDGGGGSHTESTEKSGKSREPERKFWKGSPGIELADKLKNMSSSQREKEIYDVLGKPVKEKTVKLQGMENYENLKMVKIDGIEYNYTESRRAQVAKDAAGLYGLRPVIRNSYRRVVYSEYDNQHNDHYGEMAGMSGFKAAATASKNGQVVVYKGMELDSRVAVHEAGHLIAQEVWTDLSPPKGSEFYKTLDVSPSGRVNNAVSEYGKTNVAEAFAEVVTQLEDPGSAKYKSTNKTHQAQYEAAEKILRSFE